ncbi:hypothetical protein [Actinoalloteichus caeruleus]|uniref:hypothetical protein n=1 Tax=Actinoalloteichus cyanogriseus TaxID=2893586 RepID=UPI003AACC43E
MPTGEGTPTRRDSRHEMDGRRPRAAVLDEVWRGLHGVEALSGPRGGPLSRTVKLVLDPLVIRPALHPECAGPVVTEDGAALVTALLHAAADRLRDTAAWFVLVKRVRREERITEGHPQDLYFPRCFELATTRGAPDPVTGAATARGALAEVHAQTAGRTTEALRAYLLDPRHAQRLAAGLAAAWRARFGGRGVAAPPPVRPRTG